MIGERYRCTAASARYARAACDAVAWGALQKEGEFAMLLEAAGALAPRTIMEIGCDCGGTLGGWRTAFPDSLVVGVDLPGGNYSRHPTEARAFDSHGALMVTGDSHDPRTVHKARTMAMGPVDVLFIDGDHSWEGVQADWDNYTPLVRPGGLVAFHDICPDGGGWPGHSPFPVVGVPEWWVRLKNRACRYAKRITATRELVSEPVTNGYGIGLVTLGAHERATMDLGRAARRWWR